MGDSHKRMKRREEKGREGEWRSGDWEYGVLPERGDRLYRIEED